MGSMNPSSPGRYADTGPIACLMSADNEVNEKSGFIASKMSHLSSSAWR